MPSGGIVGIWPDKDKGTMLSVAVFYLVAVIFSARRTHALPLYPDANLEPQAGKIFFNFTESVGFTFYHSQFLLKTYFTQLTAAAL